MNPVNLCQRSLEKQLAIIVDLDETLCAQFDVPVQAGVGVLRRVDQIKLQVHYVTARTTACREAVARRCRGYSAWARSTQMLRSCRRGKTRESFWRRDK